MDEWEARYQRYSLEQLEDAYAHIDRMKYAVRAQRLEEILEERRAERAMAHTESEVRDDADGPPIRPRRRGLPRWIARGMISVRLTSLLVGLATIFTAFTRLEVAPISLWVNVVPHASSPTGMDPTRIASIAVGLLLVMGALSHFESRRRDGRFLVFAWALLSVKIFGTHMVWAPELAEMVSFSFTLQLVVDDFPNVFEFHAGPAVLALMSLLTFQHEVSDGDGSTR